MNDSVGATEEPRDARWIARYVGILLGGFVPLYLLTRSSILIGDAASFVVIAQGADPAEHHYGQPGHFLQVPLARVIWLGLNALGLPVPLEGVFVGFSLIGTLAAIVFVGLIAADLLRSKTAAWLAAILFGTSLHVWTQANGEQYGLALAFATSGLFFTLRGRIVVPALLLALAVLSHSEFALASPAFVVAVWMTHSSTATTRKLVKASLLLGLAGATTVLVLLAGGWALGKWNASTSPMDWLLRSYDNVDHNFIGQEGYVIGPEVIRAIKGLLTAHTVAGHYWRDILTGRGAWNNQLFVPASTVGIIVLIATGVFMAAAAWRRRLLLMALAWLIPFHVLFNWWFVPTVEKYHGGALPGLTLLITGGLIHLGTRLRAPGRYWLYASYVIACAGLNLIGAVLPMQALGRDVASAEREIRRLNDERGGKMVVASCDDSRAIVRADVTYLRVKKIWEGTIPEIQAAIASWTNARLSEGFEPYVLDRWCLPEEWFVPAQPPFDLLFLKQHFDLIATPITDIPVAESVPTNPFSWRRGGILRLEPRGVSR